MLQQSILQCSLLCCINTESFRKIPVHGTINPLYFIESSFEVRSLYTDDSWRDSRFSTCRNKRFDCFFIQGKDVIIATNKILYNHFLRYTKYAEQCSSGPARSVLSGGA